MMQRIQRKRTKGWRLPPNAVCVTRPSKFGNPFDKARLRMHGITYSKSMAAMLHDIWLDGEMELEVFSGLEDRRIQVMLSIEELRGKILACWCHPNSKCHADNYLKILGGDYCLAESTQEVKWAYENGYLVRYISNGTSYDVDSMDGPKVCLDNGSRFVMNSGNLVNFRLPSEALRQRAASVNTGGDKMRSLVGSMSEFVPYGWRLKAESGKSVAAFVNE